jgi:hypothetical protein
VQPDKYRILNCSNCNFAACRSDDGSAVCVNDVASQCSCHYLTVGFCPGVTGIDSKAMVAFWNVYSNFTHGTGIVIESCNFASIFCDISSDPCKLSAAMAVVNCSVTANETALSGQWVSIGSRNRFSCSSGTSSPDQLDPHS